MKKRKVKLMHISFFVIAIVFVNWIFTFIGVSLGNEKKYEVMDDNSNFTINANYNIILKSYEYDQDLDIIIQYKINGQEKKQKIDGVDNEISLKLTEGENIIEITIDDERLGEPYKWQKSIYYIVPYQKQFLDELSRKGVQSQYRKRGFEDSTKSLEIQQYLGNNYVRLGIMWESVENYYTGEMDFEVYDKYVEQITEKNLKILISISGMGLFLGTDKRVNSEEELERIVNFAEEVINRYQNVYEFEIINEPNYMSADYAYTTDEDLKWYTRVFEELNERVTRNVNISIGATATVTKDTENYISSETFFEKTLSIGLYNKYNSISYHPYEYGDYKNLNQKFKNIFDLHDRISNDFGGFLKQNISEYGVPSYTLTNTTENIQADKLVQQSVIIDSQNIGYSILYNFWNIGEEPDEREDNFGLVKYDYTPKKSYYAMKKYYENTNGAEYIGTINLADGLETHVYNKDGKPKIVTWSNTKDQTIQIDYANFTAKGIYGNDIENTNGKLDITTSPVYLDNISTKYFYEAISNTALEKYSEFEEKFATEIASVEGLQENINTSKQYLESISNIESETEEIAKQKMQEHFNLGNQILTAYKDKALDVEYVKLSSMLDMLNEIGDSFEDLVTVTAKTRNPNLENTKTLIDNTEQAINNNNDLDIVYPEKILEFSKELYEDSEYINNLEEENDIKTGLIVSYDLHAKYLADWANVFTNLYIDKYIEENPITVSYSATSLTNQDVTVTLNIPQDVKITNNEGSNIYTFTENGTFTFEYERRGKTDSKLVSVNYIDKTSPEITNVENGEAYTQSVSPNVSDEHLDKVQLTFKGQVIEDYEIGDELTEEGEYKLTATDTVGNTSTVKFYIMKEDSTFKISNSYILNINPETTTKSFMENFTIIEGYKIKNEDTELGEEDKISTGDILEDEDGTKFILVVKGDLNRDGRLSIVDLSIGRKYLLGIIDIDEVQKLSSDMNTDEETSLTDLSIMRKTILGIIK